MRRIGAPRAGPEHDRILLASARPAPAALLIQEPVQVAAVRRLQLAR